MATHKIYIILNWIKYLLLFGNITLILLKNYSYTLLKYTNDNIYWS